MCDIMSAEEKNAAAKYGFVSIRVEKQYKYYKGEARIMGIYLNPGNDEFYNAVEKSKIYVDKTELLEFSIIW